MGCGDVQGVDGYGEERGGDGGRIGCEFHFIMFWTGKNATPFKFISGHHTVRY